MIPTTVYAWAAFVVLALLSQSFAQDLVCTALPSNPIPGVDDKYCNTTCFSQGAPQTAAYVAVYCLPIAGKSQICECKLAPVDCVGALTAFGDCSVSCGGGTETAVFRVSIPAQNGGKACPYADGTVVSQPCNSQSCPSLDFLCLAIPKTAATNDWCRDNCWPPGIVGAARTLDNAAPGCTTLAGKTQNCICNLIGSPSLQCFGVVGTFNLDQWCSTNCWAPGVAHTVDNLAPGCTAAAGDSRRCICDFYGPSP